MMDNIIKIENSSKVPKYEQLIKSIQNAIKNGDLHHGDILPSINSIADNYPIARDTVIKAFHRLKNLGIISSVPGKGYFVAQTEFSNRHRIFLLFDNFYSYKEALFNSLKFTLGDSATIDLYFHHCNEKIFKKLIRDALNDYSEYIIMPIADMEHFLWLQRVLTNQKVYILDVGYGLFSKHYPSVCQNFKKQWYESLKSASHLIKKYEQLALIWWRQPKYVYNQVNDMEMLKGFERFCKEDNVAYKIVENKEDMNIKKNHCYIISNTEDLVYAVTYANQHSLKIGQDIGIISHNDEPLKSIIANNGVATISTDFVKMGENMAKLILNNEIKHIENPSSMILRDSL